jgi:Pyruvate/2-oxoacid:ferredoxin oxidoreductase delta subunit
MPVKKRIQNDPVLRYHYILEKWKLAKVQRWAAGHPFFSRWVKLDLDVPPEDNDAIIIPIQETISGTENAVLPYQILEPIVKKASGHMLLNHCPCRNGEGCSMYPPNFGCLFLGEAVKDVSDQIGKQTNIAGAMGHVEQALAMGLVPMIVHASFDAALISVPYHKMLAVCFCCDCCCTVRHHLRLGPSTFDDTMQRLPGLSVTIAKSCTACGECHGRCPVHAIDFKDGISVIDQALCKGCGVCAAICPQDAPRLHMNDATDVVETLMERIRSRTDVGV